LAVLFSTGVLKVFQYDRLRTKLTYLTKVALQGPPNSAGMSTGHLIGGPGSSKKAIQFPIFDGGIAVFQDTFVIQYKDSAEFIKISNKGNRDLETVTRLQLWNYDKMKQPNPSVLNAH